MREAPLHRLNRVEYTNAVRDLLALEIDGVVVVTDVSAATSVADVVTAVNAAIDADTQVHADGSGTFNTTSPNNLASEITYGTASLLKIEGRNVPSVSPALRTARAILMNSLLDERL